jgi:hypothetical protein
MFTTGARAVSEDGFSDLDLSYSDNNNNSNIRANDNHHSLPHVQDVRVGIGNTGGTVWNRRKIVLTIGVMVMALVLIVVSVVAVANRQHNNNNNESMPSVPSIQETIAYLQDYVDTTSLSTSGSPQFRAAEWMTTNNESLEYGQAFLQRYALVVFYYATQGDAAWKHSLKFLTKNVNGIIKCNKNEVKTMTCLLQWESFAISITWWNKLSLVCIYMSFGIVIDSS